VAQLWHCLKAALFEYLGCNPLVIQLWNNGFHNECTFQIYQYVATKAINCWVNFYWFSSIRDFHSWDFWNQAGSVTDKQPPTRERKRELLHKIAVVHSTSYKAVSLDMAHIFLCSNFQQDPVRVVRTPVHSSSHFAYIRFCLLRGVSLP